MLYTGLEADASHRVLAWRRHQVRGILEQAVADWRSSGLDVGADADSVVVRIAGDPRVTPALAQIAVERATRNAARPIAYIVGALGVRRGGKPLEPYLTDQPVVEEWEARERKKFEAERSRIAVERVARRFVAQTGVVAGERMG